MLNIWKIPCFIAIFKLSFKFSCKWGSMTTNTSFQIPISLKPDVVDLWNFKLWVVLGPIVKFRNINGVHYQVTKIKRLEKMICDDCTTPFADLFNQIEEIREIFMILRNLLQKSSWCNKFDSLTITAYNEFPKILLLLEIYWRPIGDPSKDRHACGI